MVLWQQERWSIAIDLSTSKQNRTQSEFNQHHHYYCTKLSLYKSVILPVCWYTMKYKVEGLKLKYFILTPKVNICRVHSRKMTFGSSIFVNFNYGTRQKLTRYTQIHLGTLQVHSRYTQIVSGTFRYSQVHLNTLKVHSGTLGYTQGTLRYTLTHSDTL